MSLYNSIRDAGVYLVHECLEFKLSLQRDLLNLLNIFIFLCLVGKPYNVLTETCFTHVS